MDGFGDFLIVGDDYSESGGPAYAIAIHLTFITSCQNGKTRPRTRQESSLRRLRR
jgi:hypothetical protein